MKKRYTTILLSAALLLASIVMQAQTNQFRIVGGIPHMPVVANTTAVTSPVTGAMVFSQADGMAMVYNGAAWYGLTDLPDPVGSDSEPYFRVVNGLPCMAVVSSGSMFEPGVGLVYYADYGDQGLIVGDGSAYSPITDFVGSGLLNEKAMVASGMNDMLAMPVLNAAPTGITAGAFYMNATTNQFEVYDGSAWVELVSNTPPQVSNVTISGTLGVGQTVSASYTYTDAENDPEGATTFQWYRATSSAGAGAINLVGSTSPNYTIPFNFHDEFYTGVNYYIGVKVVPVATSGETQGNALTVYSATSVSVCPSATLTVNHIAGTVAPETKTITYKLLEIYMKDTGGNLQKRCWLGQNLGATQQASFPTDASDASAGWYWQFRRVQGFAWNSSTSTLSPVGFYSPISGSSDWDASYDPCFRLLGGDWRIPSSNEWELVLRNYNWSNKNGAWTTLRLHNGGQISSDKNLYNRGGGDFLWSGTTESSTLGKVLYVRFNGGYIDSFQKYNGLPVRCILRR